MIPGWFMDNFQWINRRGEERQDMNNLSKKQRRINPAENQDSPIYRTLFNSPVIDGRGYKRN